MNQLLQNGMGRIKLFYVLMLHHEVYKGIGIDQKSDEIWK